MELSHIGVDLGQSRDYTAVAVVQQCGGPLRLRYLERIPLGTPYTDITNRLVRMVNHRQLAGLCQMVVDGTGVGRCVVDMLRAMKTGCRILPVVATAGDSERQAEGYWRVPKRDLMVGLEAMLRSRRLRIARGLIWAAALRDEFGAMQVRVVESGQERYAAWGRHGHDDLVFALSLACWAARRAESKCDVGRVGKAA